jgi:hypothetical protein
MKPSRAISKLRIVADSIESTVAEKAARRAGAQTGGRDDIILIAKSPAASNPTKMNKFRKNRFQLKRED